LAIVDLKVFRERVRALYRLAAPYDDGRRATQGDLAEAVGLTRPELSSRLNGSTKTRLTERDAKAIIKTLCEWSAITSQAEAQELIALAGFPPFSSSEWQLPPLDMLSSPPGIELTTGEGRNRRGNLPQSLTSLIGRAEVQTTVSQLLTDNRLVTLIGPGGVGKSSLALAVAHNLSSLFADGAYLVELATLIEGSQIAPAICRAIGVTLQAEQTPLNTLLTTLADTNLLLVLDCCEHLVDEVARVVSQLLAAVPNLHLLATSRERLRIGGETPWEVPTLTLPQSSHALTPDAALRYEAIQLFCERAAAAAGGFRLSESRVAAVYDICVQLDGLPLAIELAAARVRLLSVEQIRAQLTNRFALLREGRRGDPRHQTLRAMIDWSYLLLSEEEQLCFRRVAVFPQDFSLEAAESLVEGNSQFAEFGSLLDKSLLRRLVGGDEQDGQDEQPRFAMLESIREYALELTSSSESEANRRHHADYFLQVAETSKDDEQSPQRRQRWMDQLETEHINLRTALTYLLDRAEPDHKATRLAVAASGFWFMRGYWEEGQRVFDTVVANGPNEPTLLRAKALHANALFSGVRGYHEQAISLYHLSLIIYRQLGEQSAIARGCSNLAMIAMEDGDYELAGVYLQESLAIARRLGDPLVLSNIIQRLGVVALQLGNYAEAESLSRESLRIRQQLNEPRWVASSMTVLGGVLLQQGRHDEAHQLASEALAIARTINFRERIGVALQLLGEIAYSQRDYPLAASLYRQSLRLRQEMGNLPGTFESLEAVANAEAMQGHGRAAARLGGAADSLYRKHKLARLAADDQQRLATVAAAVAQIGQASFDQQWAAGSNLSRANAVEEALEGRDNEPDAIVASYKRAAD